jgi:hypothetical protein
MTVYQIADELVGAGLSQHAAVYQIHSWLRAGSCTIVDANPDPWPMSSVMDALHKFLDSWMHQKTTGIRYGAPAYLKGVYFSRSEFERDFRLRTEDHSEASRPATDAIIRDMIRLVYDEEQNAGRPSPNIKQLPRLVQPRLKSQGHTASQAKIAEIAEEPQFAARRGKSGVRRAH